MGVLIVAGTVTLVALIVQRAGGAFQAAAPTAAEPAQLSLGQPAGTRVQGIAGAGERVALWVSRPDGDRVLVIDARSGRVAGEARVAD